MDCIGDMEKVVLTVSLMEVLMKENGLKDDDMVPERLFYLQVTIL